MVVPTQVPDENDIRSDDDVDSVDEALMEMLGITSFETCKQVDTNIQIDDTTATSNAEQHANRKNYIYRNISNEEMKRIVKSDENRLKKTYDDESICIFPCDISIPPQTMRRLTDELIYGSSKYQADRSYETIQFIKNGEIGNRRVLTRLENFVSTHSEWKNLCCNRIPNFLSAVLGEEMVLFKEKLNLKPPGGSGFAPHLDTPSLRVALGRDGPQTFVTVMVAIDDMTSLNGCLRVCKGPWTEHNHCEVVIPDEGNTNPDAEGRRGAIPSTVASEQMYEDIIIKGGTVALFNGWAPHRSVANMSPFPRRAVFLTYNPLQEGEFHDLYYQKMSSLRNEYKNRSLEKSESNPCHEIEQSELDALASIPR